MNHSCITRCMLLVGLLTSSMLSLWSQVAPAVQPLQKPAVNQPPTAGFVSADSAPMNSAEWHAREGMYYQRNWGVDIVDVRRVSSGEMLAFRYVVVDPQKAKGMNEARNTAYLIDEKSGTKLRVPQMEKVGALRTTMTPKTGRMYWMVFANTGGIVRPGSRVDVVIGDLHVDGLTVETK